MFTVCVKPIRRKLNTISEDIREFDIEPHKIIRVFRFHWRNFYTYTKGKCSFCVNQVRFTLNTRKMYRFVANKINFLSTLDFMQPDFIENRFWPWHLRNDIAWRIRYFHSLKEQGDLILYRQQLDFHGQFHIAKLKK